MIKTLSKSIREFKKESILSPIAVILEVIFESIMPFLVARLVTDIERGGNMNDILMSGLLILIIAFLSLISGALAGRWASIASTGFARNVRSDMFRNIQKFSFGNINKFSSSSLVTRMTTDVNNVQMAYMMIVRAAFRFPIMLVFSFIMAYIMGGKMAFIFLFTAPILAIALGIIISTVMPKFRAVFKKYDNLNNSIQENIKGIRVVKSYVHEAYEQQKFDKAADGLKNDFISAERIIALNTPIFELMLNIVMFFVLSVGSYVVITSKGVDFNVGQMSALLTYSWSILNALMLLSMIFVMLTIAQESARRITEVLEEESSLVNPPNPIYEVKDGSVTFKNASFSYEKNDTCEDLCGVNLEIKSGETVGIIGSTGSSKSTLVQLIPRLYDVDFGSVEVGGVDVRKYDLTALRDSVALVLQKNILFSGTIRDNLKWGNKNATDEEIIEAAKLAQAHDFIMGFEEGYDTNIEQGGTNVSGGQKQRISIARSLLKKPKVLILDDSTSAVDTKTDALIRQGLKSYLPDTTKIIIAQRIASVEQADKIIVLDAGKIDSIGTHEQLLENSEMYKEIYISQTKVGDDNA
ncbi:MAG: ABC transporter ATP-binding protein [Tissierellia bacterium]|nr:ABC transporter ATP-binding protein [Tissierellia bacterium]